MTVTIIQPVAAGPFGPGFQVELDSDFIGPLSVDSHWEVSIYSLADDTTPLMQEFFPTTTNYMVQPWRSGLFNQTPLVPARAGLVHGTTAQLQVRLFDGASQVDSASRQVSWEMISGAPYALQQWITTRTAPNTTQVQLVEETHQAVHMSFPGLPNIPIGEFLGIPLAGGAERLLITPDRTGEGTLDRPVGLVDVAAVGIEWEVVSAPPGVGVVQGAPDRWVRRVLDLQLVGTDASANEYTRAWESFHVDHYRYMFQGFGLTRLHYWIEPGVTIRFYWLVFGL